MDQEYNASPEQPIRYGNNSTSQEPVYQTTPRRPCYHKGCSDCPW